MIPRLDVAEILDRQHLWLEREWPAYRARLRRVGSSSRPLHNAPARRPPSARRGRARHAIANALLGAAVLVGLVLLACAVEVLR